MLKHCVFVNFQTNYSQEERHTLLAGFAEVANDVPGMLDFCFGKNLDFEAKSAGYSDGFVVTFTDREAHLAYECHPRHIALGATLVSMCVNGFDGIIVFDLMV
jgi:hypothetical protein